MNIFHTTTQQQHQPPHEIFNGDRTPHQEVPARVERILEALQGTEHTIHDLQGTFTEESGLIDVLRSVHEGAYVDFLQSTASLSDEYVYPSVFSYRSELPEPENANARRGFYSFDLYTPLNRTTYQTALESAALARHATQTALRTNQVQYALCRPPGHHAEPARMGGYCYFNNAAVAAQTFTENNRNARVAILDVDFHHGNGAEKIFAEEESVLTISLHADPAVRFPFFSGFETDLYASNVNYPLPLGTTNAQYQHVLEQALERVQAHGADALVVSFGADTHESDPIGGFALTTEYFTQMAQSIAALQLPTVILQEGGYNTLQLGRNVVAFLAGFEV